MRGQKLLNLSQSEAYAKLSELRDVMRSHEPNVRLLFIERKRRNDDFTYILYRAEFAESDEQDFTDIFAYQLAKLLEDSVEFAEYDINDLTDEYTQYMSFDDVPYQDVFEDAIRRHAALDIVPALNKGFLNRLWAYAIRMEFSDCNVTYFSKYSRSKMTMAGSKTFFNSNGTLTKVDKDLFVLDDRVDCFLYDGVMWIIDRKNFELIFSYNDAILQAATGLLDSLETLKMVENFDVFRGFVEGDLRQLRKLASTEGTGYSLMTYDYVKELIGEYGRDLTGIEANDASKMFKITDKASAMGFFRALNEEFYTTQVSQEKRVVLSKRKIGS